MKDGDELARAAHDALHERDLSSIALATRMSGFHGPFASACLTS
jgi:hypothetical protein